MITTDMIRPFWKEPEHPELNEITVLICQNKTPDLIRLCIESLLTFYPTIKILVVNGTPNDEAGLWLRYKEAKVPNLRVWDRVGYDSHGVAMHEATITQIATKYVLMLDSDVIIKHGGWIEKIIPKEGCFSAGSLMEVTDSNYAIGGPTCDADILRYIHPSCGMFDREIYISLLEKTNLKSAFADHGAPCVYTMKAARDFGYLVEGFPIADYVMHLSGASWTDPRTVWKCDNGVCLRPLVTFITDLPVYQTDTDYDVVRIGDKCEGNFILHDGSPAVQVSNNLFSQRYRITGDYVCVIGTLSNPLRADLVSRLRKEVTAWPERLEIEIEQFVFYTREHFQSKIAWL